jgi:hypothetical protein
MELSLQWVCRAGTDSKVDTDSSNLQRMGGNKLAILGSLLFNNNNKLLLCSNLSMASSLNTVNNLSRMDHQPTGSNLRNNTGSNKRGKDISG